MKSEGVRTYEVWIFRKVVASRPHRWLMRQINQQRERASPEPRFERVRLLVLWASCGLLLYLFWQLSPFAKLTLGGLILILLSHEAAHFVEMRVHGIPVEEVGLGLPFGIFRKLQFPVKVPNSDTRFMMSPLLVAAYVDEGEEGAKAMEQAGPRAKMAIVAAGPAVNIATGLILLGLLPVYGLNDTVSASTATIWALAGWSVAAAIYNFWRRGVATVIMPLLGLALVAYLAFLVTPPLLADFWEASARGASFAGQPPNVIGPVGVFKLVGISNDLVMSHIVLTILSLSMGLSNLLPIKLFDGSQLHAVVLDKYVGITWRQHILNFVTVVLFGTLAFVMIRSEFNGAVRFWIAGAITFMFAANYVNMRARLVAQALQHV